MKKISLLVAFFLALGSLSAQARTVQPIDSITTASVFTGASWRNRTELFLTRSPADDTITSFWVRYTHTPITGHRGEAPEAPTIYIKEFPISRYHEVRKASKKVDFWGSIAGGYNVCDKPDETIRRGRRTLVLKYRCDTGPNAPQVELAAVVLSELIGALRNETEMEPDMRN